MVPLSKSLVVMRPRGHAAARWLYAVLLLLLLVKPASGQAYDVYPADPAVQRLIPLLKAPTYYQTVLNIMNWVNKNIKVITVGSAGGNTAQIFARGGGHCESRNSACIALMRACGIPARLVRGNAFILKNDDISWHTITEYYLPNVGWVTWDYGAPPLTAPLAFVATYSYGCNQTGSDLCEEEYRPAGQFSGQGLNCEFVKGRLIKTTVE